MSGGASAPGGMLDLASGIFIVPILACSVALTSARAIGASIVSMVACCFGSE
jgi:uncharacterized protein